MTKEYLKLCITIGEDAQQIKEFHEEIVSLQREIDFRLKHINNVLESNGHNKITLEDILES